MENPRPTVDAGERRASQRWEEHRWSCCYLDGSRFDAQTLNISATGTFLQTSRETPTGAPVVVVFDGHEDEDKPIYLVGQVVRHQSDPVGLGVGWVRAVTSASKKELVEFVMKTLRLPADAALPQVKRSGEKLLAEFRHVPELAPRTEPGPEGDAPGRPAPTRGHLGPITEFVQAANTQVEVSYLIRAVLGGTPCEVRLLNLGSQTVTLRSAVAPVDPEASIVLELPIPRSSGPPLKLTLTGELHRMSREPGAHDAFLHVQLTSIDDRELPGGYERFLKRMACRDMTR